MSKKVIKTPAPCAGSREEFESCCDEIAKLEIERQEYEVLMKEKLQEIEANLGARIKGLKEQIEGLMERCEPYFTEHQEELCKKGQKEGETLHARFGIRTGMPKLVKKVKTAFDKLAAMWFADDKLKAYVRLSPEINKEAVINLWKDDKTVFRTIIPASVDVTKEDAFWVEPKVDEQVKS